jgi:hypothetical protein
MEKRRRNILPREWKMMRAVDEAKRGRLGFVPGRPKSQHIALDRRKNKNLRGKITLARTASDLLKD